MNRQDLVKILAKESNLTLKKAGEVVTKILKIISKGMYCGEEIRLYGFGTFWAQFYNSRTICASNGQKLAFVPARFVPKFRCSKTLKKRFLMSKC